MQTAAERRVWSRAPVTQEDRADVRLLLGGGGQDARILDWSPGGLLLALQGHPQARRTLDFMRLAGRNAPCRLELGTQKEPGGRLRADVVRVQQPQADRVLLGVRFDRQRTPGENLRRWARYLASLSPASTRRLPGSKTVRDAVTRRLRVQQESAQLRTVSSVETVAAPLEALTSARLEGISSVETAAAPISLRDPSSVQHTASSLELEVPPSSIERVQRPSRRHETHRLSSAEVAAFEQSKALDPFIGRRIGPCRVESLLGEGSFGRVYKAHHLRLDQPVALKLLTRVSGGSQALERFAREARSAAQLADLNVARVYELGRTERFPYIIQELIRGETLQARVERGPLHLAEAVRLGAGIASGLVAIHRAGLVHRDLKPCNVMITADGTPKIVDFGLVRRVDDHTLTPNGLLLGTPAFLAPEQIQSRRAGEAKESDLYAFGCVLYFALSGRIPHCDPDPERDTLTAFLARRLLEPAPTLRTVRPEVPERVARLVASLLDPKPSFRCTGATAHTILLDVHGEIVRSLVQPILRSGRQRAVGSTSGRRSRRPSSSRRVPAHTGSSRRAARVESGSRVRQQAVGTRRAGASGSRRVPVARRTGSSRRVAAAASRPTPRRPGSSRRGATSSRVGRSGRSGRSVAIVALTAALVVGVAALLLALSA